MQLYELSTRWEYLILSHMVPSEFCCMTQLLNSAWIQGNGKPTGRMAGMKYYTMQDSVTHITYCSSGSSTSYHHCLMPFIKDGLKPRPEIPDVTTQPLIRIDIFGSSHELMLRCQKGRISPFQSLCVCYTLYFSRIQESLWVIMDPFNELWDTLEDVICPYHEVLNVQLQ